MENFIWTTISRCNAFRGNGNWRFNWKTRDYAANWAPEGPCRWESHPHTWGLCSAEILDTQRHVFSREILENGAGFFRRRNTRSGVGRAAIGMAGKRERRVSLGHRARGGDTRLLDFRVPLIVCR